MEQPTIDIQKKLDELLAQESEVVTVYGKTHRVGWMHHGMERKLTHVMLREQDPWKRNVKVASCVLLNRRSGLLTWLLSWSWYWLYWRWLYYVRDLDQVEIAAILDAGKKKVQSEPLIVATILATGMMDTLMTIARHEAGRAAPVSAAATP